MMVFVTIGQPGLVWFPCTNVRDPDPAAFTLSGFLSNRGHFLIVGHQFAIIYQISSVTWRSVLARVYTLVD